VEKGKWKVESGKRKEGRGKKLGVEGAFDCEAAALKDVGVDHGGTHILVTQQFLDRADVIAILEKVSREAVAKGMAGHAFADTGLPSRFFDSVLQAGGIDVMATLLFAARVESTFRGGKEVLPGKLTRCVRIFQVESMGQVDFAQACRQVILVEEADAFDLTPEGGNQGVWQRGNAILLPFAITHGNGFIVKVNILDTQANAFHEAQSGTVKELSHEVMDPGKITDYAQDFLAR
jgi:hypothetical protein